LDVGLDLLACVVWRGIIDDDDTVVCIELIEDGIDVDFIAKLFDIVIGWDNNTDRFFWIDMKIIILLIDFLLLD
jgi:hypothetical protein